MERDNFMENIKIIAPNSQYNGVSAGVAFRDGVGYVPYADENDHILEWFNEHGYQIVPPPGIKSEGTEPEGTKPEGAEPEGTKPEGTEPEGTEPEDTKPEGAEPEGTKPEGIEPKTKKPATDQPPKKEE